MSETIVDVLIIGGGVIGLTSAWFLAKKGLSIAVLEKNHLGMGASWAGAGIIPPGNVERALTPNDKLRSRGAHLHPILHQELLEETHIDNGYRMSGGIEIIPRGELPNPERVLGWQQESIPFEFLDPKDWGAFPGLDLSKNKLAVQFPTMAQVRNPRHLRALEKANTNKGVHLHSNTEISHIDTALDRITAVHDKQGNSYHPGKVLFATGAWTGLCDLKILGLDPMIHPIRGQMAQFYCPESFAWPIVEVGKRYLVPRGDGVLLVGSTEELAGFDASVTPTGLEELLGFARSMIPCLATKEPQKSWAGLRPYATRGIPFIGPLPGCSNAFMNAGHFRWGFQFSPAAAEITCAQMTEQTLNWIPLNRFDPSNPPPFQVSKLFMS
ncbi:MAG: FAD-dependent oxidoreductase [Gemmataceae bacterium]